MPTILTKPPTGKALTPYSVSPFRRDQSVWPNPTKNWVAFMPNFLAVDEVARLVQHDREKQRHDEDEDADAGSSSGGISPPVGHIHRILDAAGLLAGQFMGPVPRPPVSGKHVCQLGGVPRAAVMFRDYLGDDVDDPGEGKPARQERIDADLVGRVVGGRRGAPGRPRLAGDADGGEGLLVQRLEGPGVRRLTSPPPGRRRRPGPASPARARSGSACRAGWPARSSTRR